MAETETVVISSKGQITIPSKLRKRMKLAKGERLIVITEDNMIKLVPVPKLSKLAGVDAEVFKGTRPSEDFKAMRKEWDKEFEKRTLQK